MGEYADMMIEGLLDFETGELIDGEAPGYPRSPAKDARERQEKQASDNKPTRCDLCGKTFKGHKALNQHRNAKHK